MGKFLSSKFTAFFELSFLVLAIALTAVGVAVCNETILGQEKGLMLQSEDHDRRIARNMERFLRARLEQGMPMREVVAAFQNLLLGLTDLSSYAIFLVDRDTGLVIAHSSLPKVGSRADDLLRRVETLKHGMPGEELYAARGEEGRPALVYTTHIPDVGQPPRMQWTLGVAADLSGLSRAIATLQTRVGLVVGITALAITLTALAVMYNLRRRYAATERQQRQEQDRALRDGRAHAAHQATLAAIGQTASMLAHEMRNPLAAMKLGLSDVLSRGHGLDERDRRRLSLSIRDVERLDGLLSDTLDYVRAPAISPRPVHLDEIVDHVLEGQEPLLARLGRRVTRRKCPACPPVHCDIAQLGQVLLNLLQNAVAACPEGGGMEIGLGQEDGMLVLHIDNDSQPLPPETLEHAFDAFFTTKPRGTGLGLAVARRIIEAHQGRIAMAYLSTGQVRVRIELPVPQAAS